ncbi:MAG: ATP-dependent RecD-like DNA helicase [Ruminococcaceae bacterium]|nr:ATP-dependent RecD-like DNA helicase [Oscillospiraceae bacterium]
MEIRGTVEDIIYENDDTGFKICYVRCGDEYITVKGTMPFLNIGEQIIASGKWVNHKEYGEQLLVEQYEKALPQTAEDIKGFLSSGLIEGVGAITAGLIVKHFGDKSLEVIVNDPARLEAIRGISHNKAMRIHESVLMHSETSGVIMFFNRFGVSTNCALNVYKVFGKEAVTTAESNPYKISSKVKGFSFKTADKIATTMGLPFDSYNRVCACIVYRLECATGEGHTFLPRDILFREVTDYTGCSEDCVDASLCILMHDKEAVCVNGEYGVHVYLKYMYDCERFVETKLNILSATKFKISRRTFEDAVASFELSTEFALDEVQSSAVCAAGENGVLVITGGPGTGKTTIIKAIIHMLEKDGKRCLLAAPTGRAAKRMANACNRVAKTLHRLLEIDYSIEDKEQSGENDSRYVSFKRNEENPLDADAVIIDEVSMVDTVLMYHLLKALRNKTRLILVGDRDQLPSVGPGKVLRDIIDMKKYPVITLNEIYRQEQDSLIAVNAHRINNGGMPSLNVADKDFFLIKRDSSQKCIDAVRELCSVRLPKAYGINPTTDIQVIIPTRKGLCGVTNANKVLQEHLNPAAKDKKEVILHGVLFREGDRVMQIKNNYELEWEDLYDPSVKGDGVFNGEMGVLVNLNVKNNEAVVVFDDNRLVVYSFNEMTDIEHCYAITVHKSQGSEFDYCVIPVIDGVPMLMTRNLLYTAITRAKKMVVLVGTEARLRYMIDNNSEVLRYTGLGKLGDGK